MSLGSRVNGDASDLFGDVGHLWVFLVASLTFFGFGRCDLNFLPVLVLRCCPSSSKVLFGCQDCADFFNVSL